MQQLKGPDCVVWSGGSKKSQLIIADVQNDHISLLICIQSYYPLINGFVDDIVWDSCPDDNEALFQVTGVTDNCFVQMLLHQSSNLVVNWV